MSWEKMSQSQCPCPCGRGRVFHDNYADDWNRYRSDAPTIDCVECHKIYHIETVNWHKPDGEYRSTHYCVPNDYPPYTGGNYQGRFTSGYNVKDLNCTQYFVENYSLDTLTKVMSVLKESKTYSKIEDRGIGATAREIVRRYKSWYNTQRITTIISAVIQAIEKYYEYECRFDTLEKGRAEYEEYAKKKKANSILLNL